jgi:putative transposase
VKYRFINDHRDEFRIQVMCRVLRVSRGGFYQWLHTPLSDRAIEDQRLLGVIGDSYVASSGVYGARRVFGDLREAGETCGKHRVAKIMRNHKIRAIRGYKAPRHIVGRPSIVAPNRLERSSPSMRRIARGSRTSPICAPGKAGSTSPSSSISTRAKSSAGR